MKRTSRNKKQNTKKNSRLILPEKLSKENLLGQRLFVFRPVKTVMVVPENNPRNPTFQAVDQKIIRFKEKVPMAVGFFKLLPPGTRYFRWPLL